MAEHKKTMLVPYSFTMEELNTVFEDQFAQLESSKEGQADHVFWDPIADYMEEFYSPVFQFSYEDQRQFQWQRSLHYHIGSEIRYSQRQFQWQRSSHYHIGSELRDNQRNQISDETNDWLHWKFHID